MKQWEKPVLKMLQLNQTEQGKHLSAKFDEVRVDQNGNYWAGFASGSDSKPSTSGGVTVIG